MKRFLFFFGMFFLWIILSSSGGRGNKPWEGEDSLSVNMISQEVEYTMEENQRQKTMNNRQNINTTSEGTNNRQWGKYRETAQKIQDRLRIVDFALQAIPIGYVITQKANDIKRYQQRIYEEIHTAPQSLKDIVPKQIKFADDLQMVMRFLTGLVVSYGAMNQMERAERQILLDHALAEVEALSNASFSMLSLIRDYKQKADLQKGILDFYIRRDKELVQDILKNFKKF